MFFSFVVKLHDFFKPILISRVECANIWAVNIKYSFDFTIFVETWHNNLRLSIIITRDIIFALFHIHNNLR